MIEICAAEPYPTWRKAREQMWRSIEQAHSQWDGGEIASIDGMRFVVPNRTFHARFNRRYFHCRRGVTALGTTHRPLSWDRPTQRTDSPGWPGDLRASQRPSSASSELNGYAIKR